MPLSVLLVDQPGWARDLVERALRTAGLSVEAVALADLSDALGRTRPDFVVLTEPPAATDLSAGAELDSPTLPPPPPSEVERIVASHLRPRLVRIQLSGEANVYDVRLSVGQLVGSCEPTEIADLVSSFGPR